MIGEEEKEKEGEREKKGGTRSSPPSFSSSFSFSFSLLSRSAACASDGHIAPTHIRSLRRPQRWPRRAASLRPFLTSPSRFFSFACSSSFSSSQAPRGEPAAGVAARVHSVPRLLRHPALLLQQVRRVPAEERKREGEGERGSRHGSVIPPLPILSSVLELSLPGRFPHHAPPLRPASSPRLFARRMAVPCCSSAPLMGREGRGREKRARVPRRPSLLASAALG